MSQQMTKDLFSFSKIVSSELNLESCDECVSNFSLTDYNSDSTSVGPVLHALYALFVLKIDLGFIFL